MDMTRIIVQSSSTSYVRSILIIDDEKDIIALYKLFLKPLDFELVCFTNPISAFEHYKQFFDKYSLIITDLRMPEINGIELAKKIRQLNSTVKVYLITAYDIRDAETQKACQEANINLILEKPLDFLEFQKTIERDLSPKVC